MRFWKRVRRTPLWAVEALPFFFFMSFFRLAGVDAASASGSWLARRLGPLTPAHKTARRNIRRVFPLMSDGEVEATLKTMWDNLGRTFAEYSHFKTFADLSNGRIELVNDDIVKASFERGKGTIFVSGHFANWEMTAIGGYQAGFDGCEVYRIANNPIINRWIVRQRERYAYPIQVPKSRDGSRELIRTLKNNKLVGMLADQKYREGISVPFFGCDAMTATGPGVLALRMGATLIPATIERLVGAHFRMTFQPPLVLQKSGDKEADVYAATLQVNQFLERAVLAKPGQWLWAHNRWDDRSKTSDEPTAALPN